jgi:hypothetical protein
MSSKEIVETVQVYVRQRPRLPTDAVEAVVDSYDLRSGLQSVASDGKSCQYYSATSRTKQQFTVDRFFDQDASQEELFDHVASSIVDTSLQGYAGLVLAYGPTSSGKTFTMRGGSLERRGLMPRCLERLLTARDSQSSEIWASYLQIYCENISDLLNNTNSNNTNSYCNNNNNSSNTDTGFLPSLDSSALSSTTSSSSSSTGLAIREKSDGNGVYVEGLSKYRVQSIDDLNELLARGDENRSTAATNMNETSSRSHAVLLLTIIIPDQPPASTAITATETGLTTTTTTTTTEGNRSCREGQLVLVDLAGSERATASEGRSFQRAEEAKAINLSLSALGNCMSALAEGRHHIPYRDSKLTRLLQHCLGATARTAVVVTVLPGEDAMGETLNALRFASRASKVKVLAKVSQHKNYEALYKDSLSKLKSLERQSLQFQRNSGGSSGDAFVSSEEVRRREEVIDRQKMDIERLQQQLLALREEIDLLKGSSHTSTGQAAVAESTAESTTTTTTTTTTENDWSLKVDKLTRDHVQAIDSMNRVFQLKLNESKASVRSLTQDVINAQIDLKQERERHLQTVQELRAMQERKMKDERELQGRVQELLEENGQKQNLVDDVKVLMESLVGAKSQLELELCRSKELLERSVSIEKVKEMEALFMETINRLADRVHNLEKSKSGDDVSSSGRPQIDQNNAYRFWNPNSDKKTTTTCTTTTVTASRAVVVDHNLDGDANSVQSSRSVDHRVVRMEPGGRIRSQHATGQVSGGNLHRDWSGAQLMTSKKL